MRTLLLLFLSLLIVSSSDYSSLTTSSTIAVPNERTVVRPQLRAPSSKLSERVRRIENGLLPLILVKGRPLVKMSLTDRMQHYKVPGVSIAVINNYEIEWARGYGFLEAGTSKPVTTETLFQAGSISKPLTAMAVLRLVQEGKLSLDQDVNRKLVSWKVPESETKSYVLPWIKHETLLKYRHLPSGSTLE